jgi:hypothetical protein
MPHDSVGPVTPNPQFLGVPWMLKVKLSLWIAAFVGFLTVASESMEFRLEKTEAK